MADSGEGLRLVHDDDQPQGSARAGRYGSAGEFQVSGEGSASKAAFGPFGSGGGGGDGGFERRISNLETDVRSIQRDQKTHGESLVRIETRVGDLATKSDLSNLHTSMVLWVIATIIGATGLGIGVMRVIG